MAIVQEIMMGNYHQFMAKSAWCLHVQLAKDCPAHADASIAEGLKKTPLEGQCLFKSLAAWLVDFVAESQFGRLQPMQRLHSNLLSARSNARGAIMAAMGKLGQFHLT